MNINASVAREFAPMGVLHASLNLGNPVLAHSLTAPDRPAGVSIDLAREFARQLGVQVVFIEFDTPGKSVEAVAREEAGIGFLAIDPERAKSVHFTPAYVEIEGCYLVPHESAVRRNEEVDAPGMKVVVGSGSAYELYLNRHLANATLIRVPTSEGVVDAMLDEGLPAAAGVKQQLEADARRLGGVRLLPGNFMVIRQAMVMPRGRSAEAMATLDAFVAEMKSSGFVKDALARHGITGARIAD
jgi:polar amino acid transport system substrate-binding protein